MEMLNVKCKNVKTALHGGNLVGDVEDNLLLMGEGLVDVVLEVLPCLEAVLGLDGVFWFFR